MVKKLNERIFGERKFAEGESVSNDTRKTGLNNNDLIVGGSGSGKTGTYIYNLLLNPYGSMVISDTKGLLCRKFSEYLKERGYKVYTLDFINPEKSSIGYNPLEFIRRNGNGSFCETDIKKLANAIMPVMDEKEPFWETAGARYIGMLIGFVLESYPPEEQNMSSVLSLHREFQTEEGRWALDDWALEHADSFSVKRYLTFKESMKTERTWACIMEFVNDALDVFDYSELKNIFNGKNSLDVSRMAREKTVIFLNSSDNDMSLSRLCDIFYIQVMQTLIYEADKMEDGRLPVPCRLVFDDFAASSKIENFDNTISIIRSREISVSIIIQSISQLESRYSKPEAQTITNNCDHILSLGVVDPETAEFMAFHMNMQVSSILKKPRNRAILITAGEGGRFVDKQRPYSVEPVCRKQKNNLKEREA
jgi:type IV secretion system protein VirD4